MSSYPAHQDDNGVGESYTDITDWNDVVIEVVIEVGFVVTYETPGTYRRMLGAGRGGVFCEDGFNLSQHINCRPAYNYTCKLVLTWTDNHVWGETQCKP